MNALKKGSYAFLQAFRDPEADRSLLSFEDRMIESQLAWLYYRDKVFDRSLADWTPYIKSRELYTKIRLLYNPAPQVVNFYVDNIWKHPNNEEFEALVTPASIRTDDNLLSAIEQLDQWDNFASRKSIILQYAAATGNCFVEGVDNLAREKVLTKAVWPGYVKDLELNETGDVIAYTLEFQTVDPDDKEFTFRKEVDKESYRYFRDNKPFDPTYGDGDTEVENLYGFVFAAWIKQRDEGGDYGTPAVNNFPKIDNVNSLACHIDDYIHKAIESPKIIGTEDGEVTPLTGATKNKDGTLEPIDTRLQWVALMAKGKVYVEDLSGLLELASADPYLEKQLKSFTDDYPELQAQSIIEQNSQLSGAALERLLTPAQTKLSKSEANYNQQLVKIRQMQIAISGWRLKQTWLQKTDAQKKFAPFNLASFDKGDLDFLIQPSSLISSTEEEREDLLTKKATRANSMADNLPLKEYFVMAGYSEERAEELATEVEQADARKLAGLPPTPELLPNAPIQLGAGSGAE